MNSYQGPEQSEHLRTKCYQKNIVLQRPVVLIDTSDLNGSGTSDIYQKSNATKFPWPNTTIDKAISLWRP